jgi:hypothetical protein
VAITCASASEVPARGAALATAGGHRKPSSRDCANASSQGRDIFAFGNGLSGYFGQTVHYAARVASIARGGEILVSSVVKQLVAGPGVTFSEGRDVELKGLDGVHQLYAVDAG